MKSILFLEFVANGEYTLSELVVAITPIITEVCSAIEHKDTSIVHGLLKDQVGPLVERMSKACLIVATNSDDSPVIIGLGLDLSEDSMHMRMQQIISMN